MEHTGTSNYETVDQFLFACDKNHNFRHAFPVTNALFDLKKKTYIKNPSFESQSSNKWFQSQNTRISFTEKTFINILPEENSTEDGENCDCH